METFKTQSFKERKSQNVTFWDFTKYRLFWIALPFVTGAAAVAFGVLTKFKIKPLDGSPDLVTWGHAKIAEMIATKAGMKEGSEIHKGFQEIKKGTWIDKGLETLGLPHGDKIRKFHYNFFKGAEVALPLSAYFLWHRDEAHRLQLHEVDEKLRKLKGLKPSNAELAQQNDVMRKELAFAARQQDTVPAESVSEGTTQWQERITPKSGQSLTEALSATPRPESHTAAISNDKASAKIAAGV